MSQKEAELMFEHLWRDFAAIAPQAAHIHALLKSKGEHFRNDHVAIRTFDAAKIALEVLAEPFLQWGYKPTGDYAFKEKKICARSYSHPSGELPRVFISELLLSQCSATLQKHVRGMLEQLEETLSGEALLRNQALWPRINYSVYRQMLEESEYAAWVMAFGIRTNHFTVNFNDLQAFTTLRELNDFLVSEGFELNSPNQPIQGSSESMLEQSSTRADHVMWRFSDGEERSIRSCYYEFCRRYPDPKTGTWYDGFITNSADKIFESTNVQSFT
ncbi:MAG: DUF1338 domain-containing protein [Myxococcales bacterium]|nr:DUF1338 domain-containing protein [Myxococcales bacterium]